MITLQVNGREMTFSEEELKVILEKHFSSQAANQANAVEVLERPTEGKWFKVNPLAIDQNLFKEKREDPRQEATRQLILEAFVEMKKNPKYARPFKTMIPKKTWGGKTVGELKMLASKLGDHNADWVEQALEWAQRIANGETWKAVCNEKDTANWYRLVVWKNGYCRLVGGSRKGSINNSATDVSDCDFSVLSCIYSSVVLVVLYE